MTKIPTQGVRIMVIEKMKAKRIVNISFLMFSQRLIKKAGVSDERDA